jgi:ERCC4-type nuclease
MLRAWRQACERPLQAANAKGGFMGMSPNRRGGVTNREIGEVLERIAELLEVQHASPYRVRAYRTAARTVVAHDEPMAEIVARGEDDGLESLPGIGKSIATTIREYVRTRRVPFLERLEGQTSPADLFTTVPGIGEELAHRIESELHIETLEDLEAAAFDGRLERVPGFGARRARGVREALGYMLRFAARRHRTPPPADRRTGGSERPPIGLLLELDHEYRERAARDELRKIAPRRFNPEHRAWLPILHVERGDWSLTALFSNTARAHELGRTDDWVVIYYERDGLEGQCTVVTERSGPARGRRVVRGRESESLAHEDTTRGASEPEAPA